MSIASRIEAIEQHLTDDYSVLTLAGADLTNVEKNILNLKPTWKERLLYFMNNGTQQVWDNWTKTTGTGETLTLNNTEEAPMNLIYKGNTLQNGTPTPDSPVPIQVVSGDNSIVVCGKNLAISDYNKWTKTDGYDYVPIKLKQGQTYTLSAKLVGEQKSSYYNFGIVKDGTTIQTFVDRFFIVNYNNGSVNNKYTFTVDQTWTNPKLVAFLNGSETKFNELFTNYELQLEVGNQATTYEPYTGESYPISLGDIELLKIGTYQDKIFKNTPNTTDYDSNLEDNVWYLKKEIGKVVLNGSENWADFSYTSGNKNFRCQNQEALPNILTPPSNPAVLLSNYFVAVNRDNAYAKTVVGIAQYGSTLGTIFISAPASILSETTMNGWKNWLSTHNTSVYYILATPTNTLIEDSTLINQLESMKKSYENQTNISQENNDMPFILDITALSKE